MASTAIAAPRRSLLESVGIERRTSTKVVVALVIVVALVWTLWPIFYIFGNSFKPRFEMFSYDLVMWPEKTHPQALLRGLHRAAVSPFHAE